MSTSSNLWRFNGKTTCFQKVGSYQRPAMESEGCRLAPFASPILRSQTTQTLSGGMIGVARGYKLKATKNSERVHGLCACLAGAGNMQSLEWASQAKVVCESLARLPPGSVSGPRFEPRKGGEGSKQNLLGIKKLILIDLLLQMKNQRIKKQLFRD